MSKHLILTLCLLIAHTPSQANNTVPLELAALGAGTVLTAFGLKMMYDSTKEKGSSGQAVIGIACTGLGLTVITQGPKHVREGKSYWLVKKYRNANYLSQKENTIKFMSSKIDSEKNPLTKLAFKFYRFALQNDPFEMIPVRPSS